MVATSVLRKHSIQIIAKRTNEIITQILMSKSTGSKNTKGIILEILNTNNVVITHVLLNWSLIGSNFFHVGTKMNQTCSNLKKKTAEVEQIQDIYAKYLVYTQATLIHDIVYNKLRLLSAHKRNHIMAVN